MKKLVFCLLALSTIMFVGCNGEDEPVSVARRITLSNDGHGTASAKVGSETVSEAYLLDKVTVTATPADNYVFKQWTVVAGDPKLSGATDNPATFTMPDNDVEIKAEFVPASYTVIMLDDGNGTAVADPTDATQGTEVTITATANPGYVFREWEVVSGSVTLADNTENPAKFNMPSGKVEIKATFIPASYTVIMVDDGNGSATADPEEATQGTEVTITATANPGYQFKKWVVEDGDLTLANDTENPTKFNMPGGKVEIRATFETIPIPEATLTNIDVLYIGLKGQSFHNHYVLRLYSDNYDKNAGTGTMISMFLDGKKTYFYDGINPDTYTYSETLSTKKAFVAGDSQLVKSDDSKFFVAGNYENEIAITGGELTIAKSGDTFTITGGVTGAEYSGLNFEYSGPMPMKRAKLNLDYAVGTYYGNYFWANYYEGVEEHGSADVGAYSITLSNLQMNNWSGYPTYSSEGPGEGVHLLFGGAHAANGSLDPVNYLQTYIPDGSYSYDGVSNDKYGVGDIWPITGDVWNNVDFLDFNTSASENEMTKSNFTVVKGSGKNYTITGNVTTNNGVEIEYVFTGTISLDGASSLRPYSKLKSDYTMKAITKAYFEDGGEEDTGLYYGDLYLGSAGSDPQDYDAGTGEYLVLSMWRSSETDLLPTGSNHFTIGRYEDYTPMTINRPILDESWEASWLIRAQDDGDNIPIFGVESISISKTPEGIYTINFVLIDDRVPANKITGSYTGEILDMWDETPID